jgi:hypothetical protein
VLGGQQACGGLAKREAERIYLARCQRAEGLCDPGVGGLGVGTLFANFDWGRWMGAAGRRAAETAFSWDTIAAKTEECYLS